MSPFTREASTCVRSRGILPDNHLIGETIRTYVARVANGGQQAEERITPGITQYLFRWVRVCVDQEAQTTVPSPLQPLPVPLKQPPPVCALSPFPQWTPLSFGLGLTRTGAISHRAPLLTAYIALSLFLSKKKYTKLKPTPTTVTTPIATTAGRCKYPRSAVTLPAFDSAACIGRTVGLVPYRNGTRCCWVIV